MMGHGFLRVGWFRVLAVSALALIVVPELPASSRADLSFIAPLTLMGSPVEAILAKQMKTAGPPKGELGKSTVIEPLLAAAGEDVLLAPLETNQAKLSNVVVFVGLGGIRDYDKAPLTLFSELFILSDFIDGKGPSSMSAARIRDDLRAGDVCSDRGKKASCTVKGGFISFYENTSPIPEPGTFLLVGSGVLGSGLPVLRGWRAR